MLKLKKTAVAVLALGSSVAFAGTMGPVCAPGNLTIPCEKTAWDVGAKALYLQPTYSGGALEDNFDTRWGWGFMIEGSYHFNTGNDFNLNWYHTDNTTHHTDIKGNGSKSSDTPKWDQVDFEFGQQIDLSDLKSIRLHAGVEYSRVFRKLELTEPLFPTALSDTSFNGFGPRFGLDLNYGLGNGFGIYGNAAGSLLIGTMKQTNSGFNQENDFMNRNGSHSKTSMVPELEGKLGVRYNYALAQGDLGLDIGYMWVNYFDGSALPGTFVNSNFAQNGLLFGLKWVGNV